MCDLCDIFFWFPVGHTSTKRDKISSEVISSTSGEKQAPLSYTEKKNHK